MAKSFLDFLQHISTTITFKKVCSYLKKQVNIAWNKLNVARFQSTAVRTYPLAKNECSHPCYQYRSAFCKNASSEQILPKNVCH